MWFTSWLGKQKVPNIYWVPKLNKHSFKARFIIAAPQCSIKVYLLCWKLCISKEELIVPTRISFQELNHFCRYKTTSLLLIQWINIMSQTEHSSKQLMTSLLSSQIFQKTNKKTWFRSSSFSPSKITYCCNKIRCNMGYW